MQNDEQKPSRVTSSTCLVSMEMGALQIEEVAPAEQRRALALIMIPTALVAFSLVVLGLPLGSSFDVEDLENAFSHTLRRLANVPSLSYVPFGL